MDMNGMMQGAAVGSPWPYYQEAPMFNNVENMAVGAGAPTGRGYINRRPFQPLQHRDLERVIRESTSWNPMNYKAPNFGFVGMGRPQMEKKVERTVEVLSVQSVVPRIPNDYESRLVERKIKEAKKPKEFKRNSNRTCTLLNNNFVDADSFAKSVGLEYTNEDLKPFVKNWIRKGKYRKDF